MIEHGPVPSHPEYENPAEYMDEREVIQERALRLKKSVEDLALLGAEADFRLGPEDREMVLQEMDIFRKVYFARMFEMNVLFKRLGWNMPPADDLINPGVPSEDLIKQCTPAEFTPPFKITHEFLSLGLNESIVYLSGSTDPETGAYGIDVEVGRNGSEIITHPATEDEIAALQELIGFLEPEYKRHYQMILQKGDANE
jgi:hypothetical protein